MDKEIEIQAAVFRRLLAHLDDRKDVQNMELMNYIMRALYYQEKETRT